MDDLLSTSEVADLFGVCPATVRRWVQAKKIVPDQISFGGGYYRFDPEKVEKLVTGQAKKRRRGK